ncbi:hypothetical protein CEXT_671151 [Caerostris extrusa]|uniref:Uncharacterized protein n=1 Tax=Caerostris extrusa TaxID=172846 RepID=A0AAV4NDA0_CAEEX|nr:hypothetical protein CEXT_671151 [Caerostris extrusa]
MWKITCSAVGTGEGTWRQEKQKCAIKRELDKRRAPPDRARFIRNKSSSGVTGCAERISFSCQTETFSSDAFLLTPFQGPPPLHLFLSFSNTNWRKTHCRLADTEKKKE